jgi:hypothetical protein
VQVYFSPENEAKGQDNLMRYSWDAGATWSEASMMSGEEAVSRDGMMGVAEEDEGGTVM